MLLEILFALMVVSAGYATLRALGLAKGAASLGIVPAAGLATTALVATWSGILGAPPPVSGVLVLLCSLGGLSWAIADRQWLWAAVRGFVREHRLAATFLALAVVIPLVSMGVA